MKSVLLLLATGLGVALFGPACTATRLEAATSPVVVANTVDFSYRIEGREQRLANLRGVPVLLVLMTTADVHSQAYMTELKIAIGRLEPKIKVVVLTIEPGEAPFVGPYAEFEKLPFSIGVAEPSVKASLSEAPLIPMTYFITPSGEVAEAAPGIVEADKIVSTAQRLLR